MGIKAAVVAGLVLLSTPSLAEWKFDSFTDRMSNKRYTFASLAPTTSDRPISLNLGCINNTLMAWLEPSDKFFVAPDIRYRFDEGRQNMHLSLATPEQNRIYLNSPAPLLKAKRFRIEIMPRYSKSEANFADFKTAGVKEAAVKASCPK